MDVMDLVIDLVKKINSLNIDLDCAKYREEKLKEERVCLEADIESLKETVEVLKQENHKLKDKIDELEF